MKYILSIILLLSISSSYAQLSNSEKACIKAENLAKKDMYNKELKYYNKELIHPNQPADSLRIVILKKYYNVTPMLMHIDGHISSSYTCYNSMADKILKRKYGPDFWQVVDQQVDSAVIRQKANEDIHIARPADRVRVEPTHVSIMRANKNGVQKAELDNSKGRLVIYKYYNKNIDQQEVKILQDILRKQYGYRFNSITGSVNTETDAYRNHALKLAKETYGNDFELQLKKKVDSARIEQEPFGDRIE